MAWSSPRDKVGRLQLGHACRQRSVETLASPPSIVSVTVPSRSVRYVRTPVRSRAVSVEPSGGHRCSDRLRSPPARDAPAPAPVVGRGPRFCGERPSSRRRREGRAAAARRSQHPPTGAGRGHPPAPPRRPPAGLGPRAVDPAAGGGGERIEVVIAPALIIIGATARTRRIPWRAAAARTAWNPRSRLPSLPSSNRSTG